MMDWKRDCIGSWRRNSLAPFFGAAFVSTETRFGVDIQAAFPYLSGNAHSRFRLCFYFTPLFHEDLIWVCLYKRPAAPGKRIGTSLHTHMVLDDGQK